VTPPISGQVWMARCDSARTTVPVTPAGWIGGVTEGMEQPADDGQAVALAA
jgi:hypothetical protein